VQEHDPGKFGQGGPQTDATAGQEAMKFGKPRTVVETVEQVMHLQ